MPTPLPTRVVEATLRCGRGAAVVVLSTVAVALLEIRGRWVAAGFPFFLWNLFLAWIPWLLGLAAARARSRLALGLLLPGWLLFLPNAPYLVTDLVHLHARPPVPLWFDALLFGAFAMAGCALGWTSLSHVRERLVREVGELWAEVAVAAVTLLAGFGIYLGRFGRWNSWDAWVRPGALFQGAVDSFHPKALAFSLVFGLFLWAGSVLVGRVRVAAEPGDAG